jgi:hypothetical protein
VTSTERNFKRSLKELQVNNSKEKGKSQALTGNIWARTRHGRFSLALEPSSDAEETYNRYSAHL